MPPKRSTTSTDALPAKRRSTRSTAKHLDASAANSPPATEAAAEEDSRPGPQYWLMKAEPESRIEKGKDVKFSIDDLAACSEPQPWDGVRNYGARNNIRAMKVGDQAFFYHSNCKEPGIVGVMRIERAASVDETAFDPLEPYYDAKSDRANPRWFVVHVRFVRRFPRTIGLHELKAHGADDGPLADMPLLKQSRLSVSAVPPACWQFVLQLAGP